MKRIQIAALCLTLLAGVCAGCADDDAYPSPERKHADGSIVLRIGTGSKTRTQLKGSYNLHHVRQVYAILYEGTGDEATYVCHHDLDWSPKDSADYAEGVVQDKAFEFGVSSTLKSGNEYTLLCVGLDDKSGATYGLTLDTGTETEPSFLTKGKTLADAKAILATGADMTTAELFAGWESFTYSREDDNQVEVTLTRRVSGAYAYVKDIPVTIDGKTVKSIQLVLGNNPTTQIGLARKERAVGAMLPDDFGSGENTATDAKILYKIPLTDDIVTANTTTNLYEIKTEYTDALGLTEQTLFLGAYLLPVEAGTNGTLSIELLDADGTLVKRFPALWTNAPTAAGDKEKYSVYPNYVYHVGTRSADSDRPASLAGDRIELVVQDWAKVDINTDFPKVPLEATIDYDKNPSKYIYDCINTTDKITIMPSLLRKSWKLTLVAEDKDGNIDLDGSGGTFNWIYFVKPDGSGYTQTLSSSDFTTGTSEEQKVTIWIYDYLNPHYSKDGNKKYKYDSGYDPSNSGNWDNINNDWRRARIIIQTDGSTSTSHISIRQYNAITVIGNYKDDSSNERFACGFSRYDYGVKRDNDGVVVTQGYQGQWGLLGYSFGEIYFSNSDDRTDYDGYYAHENVSSNRTGEGTSDWGSASDISTQPIIRYSWTESWVNAGGDTLTALAHWYLPARDELYQFFKQTVMQSSIETHVKLDELYWSSTAKYFSPVGNKIKYSYCQKLNSTTWKLEKLKGDKELEARTFRNELGYARRAHHFSDYDYTNKTFK